MSEKKARAIAVVVVGLRKFSITRWNAGDQPAIAETKIKPRIAGESISAFNGRAVTAGELREAALVVINGRVVKNRNGEADLAPASDFAANEPFIPLDPTPQAQHVVAALRHVLGAPAEVELDELLAQVAELKRHRAALEKPGQIDWSKAGEEGRKIMERGHQLDGSARVKVRLLEVEGEDLTVEQLGEALKIIGGGQG